MSLYVKPCYDGSWNSELHDIAYNVNVITEFVGDYLSMNWLNFIDFMDSFGDVPIQKKIMSEGFENPQSSESPWEFHPLLHSLLLSMCPF